MIGLSYCDVAVCFLTSTCISITMFHLDDARKKSVGIFFNIIEIPIRCRLAGRESEINILQQMGDEAGEQFGTTATETGIYAKAGASNQYGQPIGDPVGATSQKNVSPAVGTTVGTTTAPAAT